MLVPNPPNPQTAGRDRPPVYASREHGSCPRDSSAEPERCHFSAIFAGFADTSYLQIQRAGILLNCLMICQNCLNEIPPNVSACARCQLPADASSPPDEDITAELPVLVVPGRRRWKFVGLSVVGIALVSAAMYLAYVRPRALRNDAVESLRAEITRMGAPQVVAALDAHWNLRLSGKVAGAALHDALLALARRKTQFKSVVDAVAIEPSPDDIASRVAAALEARWPRQFSASVGPQLLTSVSGPVDSAEQRAAVLALVGSQPGVASVKDGTHVSPTWRRNDLRHFLDTKRWRFVTATVLDDGSIRLTGVVANENDGRKVAAELRDAFPDAPIQSNLTTWRKSDLRRKRSTPSPQPVRLRDSPARTRR